MKEITKNIVISGTSFWNPGDDFERDGTINILKRLFGESIINLLFYNFNADYFPLSKFRGISNTVAKGDIGKYCHSVDAVVVVGLSAGLEIKDLYNWVIANSLQDRVYLIGGGYENDYVEKYINEEPEATIFKNAKVIIGRTKKTPKFISNLNLPYYHINCPSILSVDKVKIVPPDKTIEKIVFSIQLPHEIGITNQCCDKSMHELALCILRELSRKYVVEVIAHHKTEYFHFLDLLKGYDIPVIFSSFYQDLFEIYSRYDLVVTTRLHSSLFANGHGIPGVIINDTDRHTHTLEGFPHSVWVNNIDKFYQALDAILEISLHKIAQDADEFKKSVLQQYTLILSKAFGINGIKGDNSIEIDSKTNDLSSCTASKQLNSTDNSNDDYQFDSELSEQILVRNIVKKGMVVFDVGANMGKYTKLFSLLVGENGKVYAFEPSQNSFNIISSALNKSRCSNVNLFLKAVYSKNTKVILNEFPDLYCSWNSLGKPRMVDPKNEKEFVPIIKSVEVEAITLDSFCKENHISRIDYLKLDVEGAEVFALEGALELLKNKAIRYLQFEISQKMLEGLSTKAQYVFDLLIANGYECHTIFKDGTIGDKVTDSNSFYENYIAFPMNYSESIDLSQSHLSSAAISCDNPISWDVLSTWSHIRLYAGDIPDMREYDGLIGLSLTRNDSRHIRHDITKPLPLPDNSVDSFQAEDVFEHIKYDQLVSIINEIFRILKPGGLLRVSLPDYGCDILRDRSLKDTRGDIVFDPDGGGTSENPGHVWFPRINNVKALFCQSRFAEYGEMDYLHYYQMEGTFITRQIDYKKGHVQRTPDFDKRVQNPYRPMSLVLDLVKETNTVEYQKAMPQQEHDSSAVFPKLSFVIIVLNGMPFLEFAVRAIYDIAHEIIIVEGTVENCKFAANPDGSSKDGTLGFINCYPDFAKKIRLIKGIWPEKLDMQNKALEYVTGDYVWLVDSDEVYTEDALNKVKHLIFKNSSITQINFIPDNFWKGFDYIFVSPVFSQQEAHYRRVFKFIKGARFTTHRPPTLFLPGENVSTEQMNLIDGNQTREMGIIPFHYSYVLESQVKQKIELYQRYGWGNMWKIDLNEWYKNCYLQWTPENREIIEKQYPIWIGDKNSFTENFTGQHPEVMKEYISHFKSSIDLQAVTIPEDITLPIIGDPYYQQKVLDTWQFIELDAPLEARRKTIQDNIKSKQSFWNIHVALAFIADKIQPKTYLEVGVRTGGSMVQVLSAANPEYTVAIDLWNGDYSSLPNNLNYTKNQLKNFQNRIKKTLEIVYIQGNSHKKLKELINQGKTFALITVDGDHSLEVAREDIEDAIKLLANQGAIIFNDIIHISFKYLLNLVYEIKNKYPHLTLLLNTSQDNGCAVFLKNIQWESLLKTRCLPQIKGTKVAGDYDTGQNLTKVATKSEFARCIRDLFGNIKPRKIIETGTYHGEGTTQVIASAIKELGINEAKFFSLECNPDNYAQAVNNLNKNNLLLLVNLLNGLSTPRKCLPTIQEIENQHVKNIEYDNIFVDHKEHERALLYFKETDFSNVPDDLLGVCLRQFNHSPDFVLLDSGGHMGNIEFNYLLRQLKGECFIALDDIYHIKHHKSYLQIKSDPRFELIVESKEKFGFCIAKFKPKSVITRDSERINNIIWVRTDSIGDNILSASMLSHIRERFTNAHITVVCQEHIAELYESCPLVDSVIGINKELAYQKEQYRTNIYRCLKTLSPDIALNSVYSREPLTDAFTIACEAKERIAFHGNLCNISGELRDEHNKYYTHILPDNQESKLELDRHKDFLKGIGIEVSTLQPTVWLTSADEQFADSYFSDHDLQPEKTIAIFAGAQCDERLYQHYGKALSQICKENQFTVLAFGTDRDHTINQQNLNDIGSKTINLSGKTTLRQTAALLKRCILAVGAETGTAHISCAVGIKNVILLGGGHFGRFMPYSPLTSVVCLPLECYGCNWKCKYQTEYCIKGVNPEVMTKAVEQTLMNRSKKPRMFVQNSTLWNPQIDQPKWRLFSNFIDADSVETAMVSDILFCKETSHDMPVRDLQQSVDISNHQAKQALINGKTQEANYARKLEICGGNSGKGSAY